MSVKFYCDSCGEAIGHRPVEPVTSITLGLDGFTARVSIALFDASGERDHWPDLCNECRQRLTAEARVRVGKEETK